MKGGTSNPDIEKKNPGGDANNNAAYALAAIGDVLFIHDGNKNAFPPKFIFAINTKSTRWAENSMSASTSSLPKELGPPNKPKFAVALPHFDNYK